VSQKRLKNTDLDHRPGVSNSKLYTGRIEKENAATFSILEFIAEICRKTETLIGWVQPVLPRSTSFQQFPRKDWKITKSLNFRLNFKILNLISSQYVF